MNLKEFKKLLKLNKKSKYNNKKVNNSGKIFDSIKESERYHYLLYKQGLGLIEKLECQKTFELLPPYERRGKKIRGIKYIADFYYIEKGQEIVEDVKGYKTQVYIIKKKLFENKFPNMEFREI